jgi:hypothetical protein
VKPAEALVRGVEGLLGDPGFEPPRLKTGTVIVEPGRTPDRFERLHAAVASTLAAPRYVEAGTEPVPEGRERRVNAYVKEVWTAVPKVLTDAELYAVAASGIVPIAGWRVTQVVSLRKTWMDLTVEQRQEVLSSIGQYHRHEDHVYNGYYPTIAGTDVAHHDPAKAGTMDEFRGGKVLKGNATATHDGTIRGGTEIRGGRREWREKTKNYVEMDSGYFAHVERIRAERQAKRDAKHAEAAERAAAKAPAKIGEL